MVGYCLACVRPGFSHQHYKRKKKRKGNEKKKKKRKEGKSTSRAIKRKQLTSRKSKFLKIHMKIAKCLSKKSNVTRRKKKSHSEPLAAGELTPKLSHSEPLAAGNSHPS